MEQQKEQTPRELMDLLLKIRYAASDEIPVHQHSPVYALFRQRQQLAIKIIGDNDWSDEVYENMKNVFLNHNEQIKKYLGL